MEIYSGKFFLYHSILLKHGYTNNHCIQARNQTSRGGSKSLMVTQKISGSLIVSYCAKHNQHANARGSGGMPPPGKFRKIDALRLNLGAFWSVC